MKISLHATDRMQERFDLTEAEATGLAERAWQRGKTSDDYSGKAKRYVLDIQTRYSADGYIVKTYGNMFFVFSETGVLCTAYKEGETFKRLKSMLPVYRERFSQAMNDELISLGFAVA